MARRIVLTSRQGGPVFPLATRGGLGLLRHDTLSDEDLQNIWGRRRPRNKLGFALPLCVLRYPGTPRPIRGKTAPSLFDELTLLLVGPGCFVLGCQHSLDPAEDIFSVQRPLECQSG